MKTLRARRPHFLSLALLAALGLTFVLTHSLDRVGAMAGVAASPAMTFTVTNTNDSEAGSLRQAIADAMPGDTIDFNLAGCPCTITLTSGELVIDKDLTIQGPGADQLTVSGGGVSRVFYIAPGNTVTLDALTIANGQVSGSFPTGFGGGIFNDEATLTVSRSTVRNNSASSFGGGIFNDSGTVTVSHSTVRNNTSGNESGGGIANRNTSGGAATLNVNNSTVSGNSAIDGGGILNESSLTTATLNISNSTISGNSSSNVGGGIFNFAQGGTARLNVGNSTISGNSASNNGGGIRNVVASGTAIVTLNSTIVSDNSAPAGPDINSDIGTISGSYNLVETTAGYSFSSGSNNIFGVDPMLGPLQDNGGPTFTRALLSGSPAIDKGISNSLPTDQRGQPRTFDFPAIANALGGDGTDIGAFERQPPGVTINQAAGQSDPTANSTVNFTAIFTEPVSGFTNGDVMVSVSAVVLVSEIAPNDGTTYNVAVTLDQCAPDVTVTASIPAGVATDADGNGNTASTSTDNTVTVMQNCSECMRGDPPQISCPGDITVVATSPAGAVVNYDAPSCLDCICDSQTPMQTAGLPSGATFPVGTTVNTYQVTDGGQTSTCSFSVTVLPPAVCPQPQGYWKNNPSAWPVTSLSLGGKTYTQEELLTLLNTPVGTGKNADASLILANQLIAARLNVASGSDPTPISAALSDADDLLTPFSGKLPYKVKPSSPGGQQMTALAVLLEQYNKSLLTPGCVP